MHDHGDADSLRNRVLISALLSIPVVLLSMIPALQFDNWQWLALALATPVVVVGGMAVPRRCLAQPPPRARRRWTR